jgi:hypothetical protein
MSKPKSYSFVTALVRVDREYHVVVPARVSKSIAVRGRIPVIARVARAPEFRGTLMPRGGGRHFLTVNGEARRAARIEPGDRVRVVVQPDFAPREVPIPEDLALALREEDVTADWESQPPGKREHIVKWIDQAVHDATRAKRIALAVDVAIARREKRVDRESRRDPK